MRKLFFSIAIVAFALSCTKEQENYEAEYSDSDFIYSVNATASDFVCDDEITRTVISQNGTDAPSFAWKINDVIGIIPMDNKTVQSNYEIAEIGSNPKQAVFDGGVWALKESKEYAAYYPFKEEIARSGDALTFSFLGQKQSANNSLAHLGDYDYMYAGAIECRDNVATLHFEHKISLVCLNLTVPASDTFSALTLESSEPWFANSVSLQLSDGTMTAIESQKMARLNLDDIAVSKGGTLTVWLAVFPTGSLKDKTLKMKLFGTVGTASGGITIPKAWSAGSAYSYAATLSSEGQEVEYVDLGLSVKWAKCNLGAKNIEEYGDYYAWGETETYYEEGYAQESPQYHWKSGKSSGYCSDSNKFYKSEIVTDEDGFGIEYKGYTKYVPKSVAAQYGFRGFFDDKTVLDPEDDVVRIKLGGKWRMPTIDEINEMINNCQCDWVNYKGVYGRKFTSKKTGYTDKWIFLPAAGYRNRDSLDNVGSDGFYWSSSLRTDYPNYAYYLYFGSDRLFTGSNNRYNGQSVRPVSE